MDLDVLRRPIVQLSLDLTSLEEAVDTAAVGVAAGVDWLEAGTPLLLAKVANGLSPHKRTASCRCAPVLKKAHRPQTGNEKSAILYRSIPSPDEDFTRLPIGIKTDC